MAYAHKEDERFQQNVAEHFPTQIVGPWQALAAERCPQWKAFMRPLIGGHGQVHYTMSRQQVTCDGIGMNLELSGVDQAVLLANAESLEALFA